MQDVNFVDGLKIVDRFQAVQIYSTLASAGRITFADQPNLRGARIKRVELYGASALSTSIQSGQTPVATDADLQAMVFTFVVGSDQVIEQMPAYKLTTLQNGTNVWEFEPTIFNDLYLDWNKCYLEMWAAPSSNPMYINLGVHYDYPENSQSGLQRNTGLR